jgi:hypothetical protein
MAANAANSQDLVDIADIRDGIVILKAGGLLRVVMVGGTNFALKSEEEQGVMIQSFQGFLNSLDYQLQIVVHSRKVNIERYLAMLESRRNNEPSGLLRNQITEYQKFVRDFVAQFAIMRKIFLVVVPFYPTTLPSATSITSSLPFFGRKKDPEQGKANAEQQFKENASQLQQRVDAVVEGIHQIGLETTVLNDQELIELYYNFYNPDSVERDNLPVAAEKTDA